MAQASRPAFKPRSGLNKFVEELAVIGNVGGNGLFFGAELVLDRDAKTPAPDLGNWMFNEMRNVAT